MVAPVPPAAAPSRSLMARLNPFAPAHAHNPIAMRANLEALLNPTAPPPADRTATEIRLDTDLQARQFVKNISLNVLFSILFLTSGHTPDSAVYFKLVDLVRRGGTDVNVFDLFLRERERLGGPLSFSQKCRARFFYMALYSCSSVLENTLHEIVGKVFSTLRDPRQKREAQEAFLDKALSVVESALNIYIGAKQEWARNPIGGSSEDHLSRALAADGPLPDLYAQFTGLLADHIFTGFSFFRDTRAYLEQADRWKGAWKLLYHPLRLLTSTLFALADLTTIRLLNYSTRTAIRTFAPPLIQSAVESTLGNISPSNLTWTNTLHELGLKHLRQFHQKFQDTGIGGDEAGPDIVNPRIIQVAERLRTLFQLEPLTNPREVLEEPGWTRPIDWCKEKGIRLALDAILPSLLDTGIRYTLDNLEEILGTAVESLNGIYTPGLPMTQEELEHKHEHLEAAFKEEVRVFASDVGLAWAEERFLGSPSVPVLNRRLAKAKAPFAERVRDSLLELEQSTEMLRHLLRHGSPTSPDPQIKAELAQAAQAIVLFDNWRATQGPRWARLPAALRTKLERMAQNFTVQLSQATALLTNIAACKTEWVTLAAERETTSTPLAQLQFATDLWTFTTEEKQTQLLQLERERAMHAWQLVHAELALKRNQDDPSEQARLHLKHTLCLVRCATFHPDNRELQEAIAARQAALPPLLANSALSPHVRTQLLQEQESLTRPRKTAEQAIEEHAEFILFRKIKRASDEITSFLPDLERALEQLNPSLNLVPLHAQWQTLLQRERECTALNKIDLEPLLHDLRLGRRHVRSATAIRSRIAQVSDAALLSTSLDQIERAPTPVLRDALVSRFRTELAAQQERHTASRNAIKQEILDALAPIRAAAQTRLTTLEARLSKVRMQIETSLGLLSTHTASARTIEQTLAPTFANYPRESFTKKFVKWVSRSGGPVMGGTLAAGAAAVAAAAAAAVGGGAAFIGGTSVLSGALGGVTSALGLTTVAGGAAPGAVVGGAAPSLLSWARDTAIDLAEKRVGPLITKQSLIKAVAITAMRRITTAAHRA